MSFATLASLTPPLCSAGVLTSTQRTWSVALTTVEGLFWRENGSGTLWAHICAVWTGVGPEQDDSRKEVQQLRLEQDDSEWLVKVISLWSIFVFHWQGRVVRLVCLLMYTLDQTQFLEGHCSVLHSAPTLIKHTWSRSTEIIKVFRIRNFLSGLETSLQEWVGAGWTQTVQQSCGPPGIDLEITALIHWQIDDTTMKNFFLRFANIKRLIKRYTYYFWRCRGNSW